MYPARISLPGASCRVSFHIHLRWQQQQQQQRSKSSTHTNSILNLVNLNQIWIVITFFQLDLAPIKPPNEIPFDVKSIEKFKYNPDLVLINKIQRRFSFQLKVMIKKIIYFISFIKNLRIKSKLILLTTFRVRKSSCVSHSPVPGRERSRGKNGRMNRRQMFC